jgi:hypothetical protein
VGDALEEIGSSLWDALEWAFLHIVAPLLALGLVGGVIGLSALVGLLPGAVFTAGLGAAMIATDDPLLPVAACALIPGLNFFKVCRISETENHLLMMETSRYLTNQIFRSDLEAANATVPSPSTIGPTACGLDAGSFSEVPDSGFRRVQRPPLPALQHQRHSQYVRFRGG